MRAVQTCRPTIRSFIKNRDGGFAIITAVIATLLAITIGFAVNVTQIFQVRSNLSNALDSAVTSTARDITTGTIQLKDARASVEAFLKANGDPEGELGERLVLDELIIDQTAKIVSASAHIDARLFFPVLSIGDVSRVGAASASIYSDRRVEVAMMLDITGSMKKSGKIDKIGDLQKAASAAVEQLLENEDPKNPRVRVAIVPYSETVNTGKLSGSVFVEKAGGPDLPPPIDQAVSVATETIPDTCATERKTKDGAADFSADGPNTERTNKIGKIYLAKVNRDDRVTFCPKAQIVPLTADKQKLLNAIKAFSAEGYTAGAIAAQWGYYMLSPKWRSAISDAGLGEGPADHNAKKVNKVAILMTDGQFNTAFAGVSSGIHSQGTKSRSYAESLCANMKSDGITVYTIGFDLDSKDMSKTEKDQAKGVLKTCSSPDTSATKHYFEASTGPELDDAFKAIIANIEGLVLTK